MPNANVRVVLVRPKFAGNIGAVARVMRNTGLDQLTLVAPQADLEDREARKLSTHGESILDRATIVDDLSSAISDCVFVVGTTARTAGSTRADRIEPPEKILPRLHSATACGNGALVFGPETNGLTNEEVDCCHALVSLPLEPDYPAMNLAQSAAVLLYLLRRSGEASAPHARIDPLADAAELEKMFTALQSSLERVEYLRGDRSDDLCQALRRMLLRSSPTRQEVRYLFGLARQIQWFADRRDES
jgi:TrmH family RNA methyltransferase